MLDVNDNPPVFTRASYRVAVPEDTPVGAELLQVEASDADPGPHGLIRFTLSSGDPLGLFELDESSGDLRLARPLDCETQTRHQLVVQAADPAGAHFALAPVTIEVQAGASVYLRVSPVYSYEDSIPYRITAGLIPE